jgi:hypothetical protein
VDAIVRRFATEVVPLALAVGTPSAA